MATNTTTNPTPEENTQTDFMSAIQDKLLGQSSIISSTNSNLEERLNAAISGLQTSAEKSNLAIESTYGRERAFQEGQAGLNIQNQLEGRSGFATQMVAFRNLVETTDKNLKDLEQRKNELILQNDSAAASKISELQFKALEFKQQAEQQTFSNLLGIANFGLQAQQEQRLAQTQKFAEQQAINSVALEFGINPAGKTLEQVVNEAAPTASALKRAELARTLAQVKESEANATRALRGEAGAGSFDETTASILANAFRTGNIKFLDGLKTNEQFASVFSEINKQDEEQRKYIESKKSEYQSMRNVNDIVNAISKDPNILISAKEADRIAIEIMASKPKQLSTIFKTIKEGGSVSQSKSTGSLIKAATGEFSAENILKGLFGGFSNF